MSKPMILALEGGHDTKYKFENGQIVNRVSGEAIPEDEPIMIFRGRDVHALTAITEYFKVITNPEHRKVVGELIMMFHDFKKEHPDRMKEPDTSPRPSQM